MTSRKDASASKEEPLCKEKAWQILKCKLVTAIQNDNVDTQITILKRLLATKTVRHLAYVKEAGLGKTVQSLTKSKNEKVSDSAKAVVDLWLGICNRHERHVPLQTALTTVPTTNAGDLLLPSNKMLRDTNWLLPGRQVLDAMSAVLKKQHSNMYIYTNAMGKRSNKEWPMGVTASFEARFHNNKELATEWSTAEWISNIFDASSGRFKEDYVYVRGSIEFSPA